MEGSERTMDMTHRRRCKQADRQDIETEKTTNNNFVYGVEPNKMEGWLRSWIRGWDLGLGLGIRQVRYMIRMGDGAVSRSRKGIGNNATGQTGVRTWMGGDEWIMMGKGGRRQQET
jgi:hypothetical protein